MDDLEFWRRAYAAPDNEDRDFLRKKNESVENVRFVEELKQLDDDIRQVLRVDVPEGLEQRIKLKQTLGSYREGKKQARFWLSIAASMLIVVGISVMISHLQSQNDLSRQLLTHVYAELNHLQDEFNYPLDRTNQVLSAQGAHLRQEIGVVKYVGKCEIGRQDGVHMVLQGQHGPVTVMMMPNRKIDSSIVIADQRFQGSIEPLAQGSVAIIAERGEHTDRLKRQLQDNLHWLQ